MIREFLDSWPLFRDTYLVGWLVGLLLAPMGVFVVARDQIFIGAAVSQASVLGIAAALWLAHALAPGGEGPLHAHEVHASFAVLFAAAAALAAGRPRAEGEGTAEAATGWVYLAAGGGAMLLVSKSPYGLEEIHRVLSSSLIGATEAEAWTFGALLALSALAVAARLRPLTLLALDPAMAASVGVPVGRWSAALALWMGLCLGLAMHVTGMLYGFGALVLPALIAQELCREVRAMVYVAPAVSLGGTAAAFVLANHYDLPPGQAAVAVLAAALAAAWAVRRVRPRRRRARRGATPSSPG